MGLLEISGITKRYEGQAVLSDVSVEVEEGEILCLLGPSGSGKSTLLRIVAGLEAPDAGHVSFAGRPLADLPVHRRGFGLMFQDYALFPHKDVAANVAFGLRMEGRTGEQIESRVSEMLALVGLEGYEARRVYDLSGGEQQRVALARSLAPGPRLLMLDEPLGSLDRALREELMNEVRAILKQAAPRGEASGAGVTAIYVTHDQQEAFAVADRVAILRAGRIVQRGTPQAVYRRPATPWVARFLGLTNLITGRVIARQPLRIETPIGTLSPAGTAPAAGGEFVTILIRPEAAKIADVQEGAATQLHGTVERCSFRGSHYRLQVRHASGMVLSFHLVSDAGHLPRRGEGITLALRPEAMSLLPASAAEDQESEGSDDAEI
jgi:ABC-type Fe3+/spermidine/putrescine transport system ATPase subunit